MSNVEYSGTQELLENGENLSRYNRDIVLKLAKGLEITKEMSGLSLVEFGAGAGALADVWRRDFQINPICIEIDPNLIQVLKSKGFEVSPSIESIEAIFSAVYTSNCLEHIENDIDALQKIHENLPIDGRIAIYVPALPILFSDLDKNIGHFRRYRRRELIKKVKIAGFTVDECFYNDSLGVPASLALKFLGFKNRFGIGSKRSLIFYDKYLYPISMILDKIIMKNVIGKNLVLFASKKLM